MNETMLVTATFLFSPSVGHLVCIMSRFEFTSMSKLTCITAYANPLIHRVANCMYDMNKDGIPIICGGCSAKV